MAGCLGVSEGLSGFLVNILAHIGDIGTDVAAGTKEFIIICSVHGFSQFHLNSGLGSGSGLGLGLAIKKK